MLYINFGSLPNEIRHASPYFDIYYEPEWLSDELNKQMILDVDKSKVIAENIIESPLLGTIPPQWLSGGVKCLILMNSENEGNIFNASNCGDNCSKWIREISKKQDLVITLHHYMVFNYEDQKNPEFHAKILNSNREIFTIQEYNEEYEKVAFK